MRTILPARSRALSLASIAVIGVAGAAHATVTISDKPTSNMSCDDGVCSPTAKKANLNVTDLANLLAASDVKVVSDSNAVDIQFAAPLSWTSTSRLTLDSYRSIVFQQPISVTGTGALTITTNDGGSGGDFWFERTGRVNFWDLTSSLVINGSSYVLVSNLRLLAGKIRSNPSGAYALARNHDVTEQYSHAVIPTTFTGRFEGLGNSISHLRIDDPSTEINTKDALFARADKSSLIRDILLPDVQVSGGTYGWISGLAAVNFGRIQHCVVSGQIAGTKEAELIAGIAADNHGSISDTKFTGTVSGAEHMGGFAAWNYPGGVITTSITSATVSHRFDRPTSDFFVGGLVGANQGWITFSGSFGQVSTNVDNTSLGGLVGGSAGNVSHGFADVTVINYAATGSYGGLMGYNASGTIEQSSASGSVDGGSMGAAGGLVGRNGQGTIRNSYATGSVSHGHYVGGLVGDAGLEYPNEIITSYSTGMVRAGSKTMNLGGSVGAFGTFGTVIRSAYWDLDTSGVLDPANGCGDVRNCPGLVGLKDEQLRSGLPRGFASKVWGQSPNINNGYPYLLANPPPKK